MNMKTYQQIVLYIIPLLGQMQFINTVLVLVRLYWFENKFKDIGTPALHILLLFFRPPLFSLRELRSQHAKRD